MAHIKRIDLTRDVEAHADAYREAIEKVCKETAFSGGKYADTLTRSSRHMWEVSMLAV